MLDKEHRKDFQRDYQKAAYYQRRGIPVPRPSAFSWQPNEPLMTVPYTTPDGTLIPARNADEVFEEMKNQRRQERVVRTSTRNNAVATVDDRVAQQLKEILESASKRATAPTHHVRLSREARAIINAAKTILEAHQKKEQAETKAALKEQQSLEKAMKTLAHV